MMWLAGVVEGRGCSMTPRPRAFCIIPLDKLNVWVGAVTRPHLSPQKWTYSTNYVAKSCLNARAKNYLPLRNDQDSNQLEMVGLTSFDCCD